ncbi:MAG: alpha-amylase family glycosyl hydrolase [Actinobacteria bacterium]|nr:alpha-amylase family glycosyl hydrolase [Actinomycetota bacterium]
MKRKITLALFISVFLSLSTISFGASPSTTKVGLSQDLIYFVMPDRYKDGDKKNNDNGGFNTSLTAFWHGGDLKGLTGTCEPGDDGLTRIKSLGFTAVWLTPVVTQQEAIGSGSGYHGYWGVDFLNVDPHLGTNADMLEFSKCAKKLGLKIILDVVTNHTGDVIKYRGTEAYVPAESKKLKNPAWLNDINNYHNVGDMGSCWGVGNCTKLGDFYGLDDLATEKPVVYKGWADVYGQWILKYGISAFRVDTARHVDDKFFKNWSPLIQAAAKKSNVKDFTIFGEVFDYSTFNLMTYVRQNKIQTILDFPFQAKATEYASGYSNAAALTALFENDDYYTSAQSSASNLITFLGNHDVGRVGYTIANKRIQPADQLLPRTNLANALMYFSRGIPVVYYGDEVGMTGSNSGKDQFARQDMFPTDIELWKNETRVGGSPIGNGDAFSATSQSPVANYLIKLAEIRKNNPALANGPMLERYSKYALYVISKKDVVENKEYLVAFNNSDTDEVVEVTTATSTGGWSQILGTTDVVTNQNKVTFTVPALSTIVLKANNPIDQFATSFTKLSTSMDDLTGFYKVKAGLKSKDFLSVEFFARNAGSSQWISQGVED